MIKIMALIAAVSVVSGCAVPVGTTQVINLTSTFDVRGAQAQTEAGNAAVIGNAFMQKRDRGIMTCAGNDIYLVPATDYAQERFSHMYSGIPSTTRTSLKRVDEVMFRPQKFFPDPPEYYGAMKVTTCDALGNFEFSGIRGGDYFLSTHIYWEEKYWEEDTNEGGALARRVIVQNGQTERVTLSP